MKRDASKGSQTYLGGILSLFGDTYTNEQTRKPARFYIWQAQTSIDKLHRRRESTIHVFPKLSCSL